MENVDFVINSLKARWFELAKKERIGETPDTTQEIDRLTVAIRELEAKLVHSPQKPITK